MNDSAFKLIKEAVRIKSTSLVLNGCDVDDSSLTLLNELSELSSLTYLNLSNNKISNIKFLEKFTELKELYLGNNNINDLNPLSKLSKLVRLNLEDNHLTFINGLEKLSCLNFLSLSNNNISNIEPLENLVSLKSLKLKNNRINNVKYLEKLENLRHINLISNSIVDLRPLLPLILYKNIPVETKTDNYWNDGIYIRGNKILLPPYEILSTGYKGLKSYIEELEKGERPLNEAKVILIGEGGAGKTSLVKRLSNEEFDNNEKQTHGIVVKHNIVKIKFIDIHVRYWDFGGQEIMHATHQFFLTKRSVYILVLDSRKEDQAEYWLKHIQYFGGSAPTLVVLNKIDENPSFQLNQKHLSSKYPFIVGFYRISCCENTGINELENKLKEEIWNLELRKEIIPNSWFKVKEYFENMEKDYISHEDYVKVCRNNKINDENGQMVLLGFLHDLGIIFYYEKMRIHDTNVLNPEWLTNAVYKIINSPISASLHGFDLNEIDNILEDTLYRENDSNKYNNSDVDSNISKEFCFKNKYHFIIEMMKQFELCYEVSNNKYIIPELLPVEQNEYNFSENDATIKFIIEYENFLPTSVIPRLMVRLSKYLYKNYIWKTGMVIKISDLIESIANVIADNENKKLILTVSGKDSRKMLQFIRDEIKEINKSFFNLKVAEYVPLPGKYLGEEVYIEYDELLNLESMGEKEYVNGKLNKRYNLNFLLNGYELEEIRKKEIQPLKIFISYSKHNIEYLENFKTHLMSLKRLGEIVTWDDKDLIPGENWDNTITSKLNEANIIILLITDKLIATNYVWEKEIPAALEREEKNEVSVIPIIVDFCHWEDLPFAKNQVLPSKGIPITNNKHWSNENEAWKEVIKGLKKLIEHIQDERKLKKEKELKKDIHLKKN